MDRRQREELAGEFQNRVHFDCPLGERTTFRVGGNAEALCSCEKTSQVEWLLSFAHRENIPSLVIGKGSNLLVRETGVQGLVVRLSGELAALEEWGEDVPMLKVGGGTGISDVLAHCKERGLGGLEFLSGIPGTVGGAVAMNAGAWGQQMEDLVWEVSMVTGEGVLTSWDRSRLRFSYRDLALPRGSILVMITLVLQRESPEVVSLRMKGYLNRRKETQPLEYASAGSIFKNPPQRYAGKLIEEVGLKGKRIGGAMISPKHANFIVNVGGARAEDILALMDLAREEVRRRTGVELEPEIRVIG